MAEWGNMLRRAARVAMDLLSGKDRSASPGPARPRVRTVPSADRADRIVYAPQSDGAADPGEIVWAWVPFEEGDGRGKDRPLLVVGRRRGELAALMLSSQADRAGDRNWVSIGSGAWDRQGRESFVRLDRVLELTEDAVRREGAVLDRPRFDRVATELRTRYHWH